MFDRLPRTAGHKPGLFRFALFAVFWSVLLAKAGYITTTIEAGMVFLDWPLSNGSFNPDGWLRDPHMAAEHGHRLFATALGLQAIGFAFANFLLEARPRVRALAWAILAAVILQGLLGGLRVLLDRLNIGTDHNHFGLGFATAHATFAQITFGLIATHALVHSRSWISGKLAALPRLPCCLRALGVAATVGLVIQVALGALVRHYNVGLAIHTFPKSTPSGDWLPTVWNWGVTLNFAHRVGAIAVTVLLLAFLVRLWLTLDARRVLGRWAAVPAALLLLQIKLGWLTTVTLLNPHWATLHAFTGAFLVVTTWVLSVSTFAGSHANASNPAPAAAA